MHGKADVRQRTTAAASTPALPERFSVIRYHSLAIERESLPARARDHLDRERRRDHGRSPSRAGRRPKTPLEGVQFHPESILTEHGHAMLKNFLEALAMNPRGRPAQRHGDPVRRRRCAPPWPTAPRSATTSSATTRRVNALQEKIAALLGKEAALYVASGTQSNLVAIMSHCGRGDEYIVGQMAHTYRWEGGGAAVLGSVQPQPLEHEADGSLSLGGDRGGDQARRRALREEPPALPREHDRRQGAAARLPRGGDARLAKQRGLATHLDGARALQCRGQRSARSARGAAIAAPFDQRLGLLLEGPGRAGRLGAGRLARVHRRRRTAGARWSAAACARPASSPRRRCYALDHHVDRLADDHALAARLAEGLQGLPGLTVEPPQTNIVFADLDGDRAAGLIAHLKSRGVLATGLYRLRFVTHLDVDAEGVDRAVGRRCASTCTLNRARRRPCRSRTPTR